MSARIGTAFLLAFTATPAVLHAQQQQQPPAEVQEWVTEVQQIQQQLQPLQQQALLDSALQQQQQRAADALRTAMIESDSTLEQKMERLEAIMQEAQQAQATGDEDRIVALTHEAQRLQPVIAEAQAEAFSHPDVAPQVNAFQQNLREKMVEIDPEARPLLDRLAQLQQRIEQAVRGGGVS